jgi:hypothetical protein
VCLSFAIEDVLEASLIIMSCKASRPSRYSVARHINPATRLEQSKAHHLENLCTRAARGPGFDRPSHDKTHSSAVLMCPNWQSGSINRKNICLQANEHAHNYTQKGQRAPSHHQHAHQARDCKHRTQRAALINPSPSHRSSTRQSPFRG